MESQGYTINEYKGETASTLRRKAKSLANGEASRGIKEEEELHEGMSSTPWSSLSEDEYRVSVPTTILRQEEEQERQYQTCSTPTNRPTGDLYHVTSQRQEEFRPEDSQFFAQDVIGNCSRLIQRRLQERHGAARRRGVRNSSICIFRFPPSLVEKNQNVCQPELVSIGPYYRGKDQVLEFEEHKWSFLEKFLSRKRSVRLDNYLGELKVLEQAARDCYSDIVQMSSHDFIEMMLLDGCFILEVMRHLNHSGDDFDEDDPIFTKPWLIPILIRDLLKLENQLPYSVLHSLFTMSGGSSGEGPKKNTLPVLALSLFDLAFPRPIEILDRFAGWTGKHLLDLFYTSLLPSHLTINCSDLETYHPSAQSIQCVTQLRPAGIKFKSRKASSFLDITFRNHVLEIPSITINDFTSTMFVNCIALEQCEQHRPKYVTDYVSFMSCLINQPRDVAFLCSYGIFTRFSRDDKYVADLFSYLGRSVEFNIRDRCLSKLFREVESYYSSYWATMRRTYFSSPWSFISVFSAFILLVLTLVQTVMSVLQGVSR